MVGSRYPCHCGDAPRRTSVYSVAGFPPDGEATAGQGMLPGSSEPKRVFGSPSTAGRRGSRGVAPCKERVPSPFGVAAAGNEAMS